MSWVLAITAVLLWLAVLFEGTNQGVVRRFIGLPFALLALLFAWFFQLVSGCRIIFDLERNNRFGEPIRMFSGDELL